MYAAQLVCMSTHYGVEATWSPCSSYLSLYWAHRLGSPHRTPHSAFEKKYLGRISTISNFPQQQRKPNLHFRCLLLAGLPRKAQREHVCALAFSKTAA